MMLGVLEFVLIVFCSFVYFLLFVLVFMRFMVMFGYFFLKVLI